MALAVVLDRWTLAVPGLAVSRIIGRGGGTVGGGETLLGELGVQFDLASFNLPVSQQLGSWEQFTHDRPHSLLGNSRAGAITNTCRNAPPG